MTSKTEVLALATFIPCFGTLNVKSGCCQFQGRGKWLIVGGIMPLAMAKIWLFFTLRLAPSSVGHRFVELILICKQFTNV